MNGRRYIPMLRRDAKAHAWIADDGLEDEICRRLYGERRAVERVVGTAGAAARVPGSQSKAPVTASAAESASADRVSRSERSPRC